MPKINRVVSNMAAEDVMEQEEDNVEVDKKERKRGRRRRKRRKSYSSCYCYDRFHCGMAWNPGTCNQG